MLVRQLFDQDTFTYTYLVADRAKGVAALIDPVAGQLERDLKVIAELGLRLVLALDTHVHADHITGAGQLRERTGCRTIASRKGAECVDQRVDHGDRLELGDLTIDVLATPGHTDDSVSYRVGENVFTGDALFVRGTGRTDFQNGDAATLYRSITETLFALPEDTIVWPGHDYRGHTATTIGEEKRHNPRVANKTLAEFKAIMDNLNLPRPKYLDQAVPANRECGLGLSESETPHPAFKELDTPHAMAFAREQGATIVDVREPHEFVGELGHIEGAESIPAGEIAQAALDWSFDTPLLVVCRSGRRSRGICDQLINRGFRNVVNLRGGMVDYRKQRST